MNIVKEYLDYPIVITGADGFVGRALKDKLQNLGFKTEGVYRMHGIYDGRFCDTLRMALFNLDNPLVKNYFNLA